jgi:Flp pilus assembly protein TadB
MNRIESHINKLFWDIPDSRRKTELILEISQDLEEKIDDLVCQGLSEDEAVQKAFNDFGDMDEIKRELIGSGQLIRNKKLGLALAFSVWSAAIITLFFLFINLYYTPHTIWFVYPVFAVIWWPMTLYFCWYRRKTGNRIAFPYSLAGSTLIIWLMLFINFYYTPHTIWFVYPVFAVLWWPVALFFHWLRHRNRRDGRYE